jgi:DNA (cytosine-5)-methyltransferase 1
MNLTYASVCSGIEAASTAWHPLGWRGEFVSEIEPFPCAMLEHHYPKIPNYGDMTKHKNWTHHELDILVGGTPCQAFSVAGLREGLADPRGNLTLTFLSVVEQYRPRWVVWENVPGVLSDQTGAFNAFLTGLAKCGYGFAYRILDAQYFGVAQRRRRVFVVGHIGGLWQRAAAVLFERESLCWNSPPSRTKREDVAPTISARTEGGGGLGTDFDCDGGCIPIQHPNTGLTGVDLDKKGCGIGDAGDPAFTLRSGQVDGIAQTLRADGGEKSHGKHNCDEVIPFIHNQAGDTALGTSIPGVPTMASKGGSGNLSVCLPVGIDGGEVGFALRSNPSHSGDKGDGGVNTTMIAELAGTLKANNGGGGFGSDPSETFVPEISQCLNAGGQGRIDSETETQIPVAFNIQHNDGGNHKRKDRPNGGFYVKETDTSLTVGTTDMTAIKTAMAVRRLTPRECERLQGFPDDYTLILFRGKPASDSPRYKALGNSMAVPVMSWIGRRIEKIEELT